MRTSLVKNLIQRNSKQFSGLLSIFRSIVHFQVYCPFTGLLSIFRSIVHFQLWISAETTTTTEEWYKKDRVKSWFCNLWWSSCMVSYSCRYSTKKYKVRDILLKPVLLKKSCWIIKDHNRGNPVHLFLRF